MKENIIIQHGMYDIINDTPYHLNGYFHKETQIYMPISNKLKTYLSMKGVKFNRRYNAVIMGFTLARCPNNHTEVIALCHPLYDSFDFELGEDIALGRMKRMLGDVKKVIYETEWYEHPIYFWDDKGNQHIAKTIKRKRVKRDAEGEPIVKRIVYFKPYNLDKRYRIKHKNKPTTAGELMYPYIYKLVK